MTIITTVQGLETVTKTSTTNPTGKTAVSSPVVMGAADKTSEVKELSAEKLQAKMEMEKAITSKLGFKGLFQDPYISANISNENGKWVVTLTKTKDASALVWDRGAKQYEIEHICGQLGVELKDLRNVEYATDRRVARRDATIEVGRSVQLDLAAIGTNKFYLPWVHDGITNKAKETSKILLTK